MHISEKRNLLRSGYVEIDALQLFSNSNSERIAKLTFHFFHTACYVFIEQDGTPQCHNARDQVSMTEMYYLRIHVHDTNEFYG